VNILKLIIKFFLIPILILWLLFLLGNYIVMPIITRHGDQFAVPDIVVMTQGEAEELFAKHDIHLQINGREYSPDKPEGVVLIQLPPAGMMIKKGRIVRIVISAGARVGEVPDVFGLPLRQADLAIQEAGFVISDMFWTQADSLPENVAIETIPAAGTVLPLGSSVALAVNQGNRKDYVFMPSLIHKPLPRARQILDSLGLFIDQITRVRDTLLLPNTVIEQTPLQHAQIPIGASVLLTVSETD